MSGTISPKINNNKHVKTALQQKMTIDDYIDDRCGKKTFICKSNTSESSTVLSPTQKRKDQNIKD